MPQKILIGSSQGVTDIELDTNGFFEWIDESNPFKDYYKNSLLDYYQNQKSQFEENNTEIIFKLEKLSDDESLLKKYLEHIPDDIVLSVDEDILKLDKPGFYEWQGLEYKLSLFSRIFGG